MPLANRQLAAIMFTDMVGFTSIMGSDDAEAYRRIRANRRIHKKFIRKYRGKWLKEMGDGTLASFKTVSDAAYAAGEIMHACKEDSIDLRIGIHFGEVTTEWSDVFGNGVNIASRVEALAEPGQILVSGPVYQNVKNLKGIDSTFYKEQVLKHVEEPVKIYELLPDPEQYAGERASFLSGRRRRLALAATLVAFALLLIYSFSLFFSESEEVTQKSIAVLPFTVLSSGEDDQYFARGVKEAIENQLSTLKDLMISSPHATAQYLDTDKPLELIAEELNVRYILSGSVQRYDENVRITARIYDILTSRNIWSDQYTDEINNFFNIMDNVAGQVTMRLAVSITPEEEENIHSEPTQNFLAYDLYMKGRMHYGNYRSYYKEEDLESAEKFFKEALQMDSAFALAYAGLGEVTMLRIEKWNSLRPEAPAYLDSLGIYMSKAHKFGPELAESYVLRGQYHYYQARINESIYQLVENDILIEKAIRDNEKAIALRPNLSEAYFNLGRIWLDEMKDPVQAFRYLYKAREYEKSGVMQPDIIYMLGVVYMHVGAFEEADRMHRLSYMLRPGDLRLFDPVVWNHIVQGKYEKALQILDSINVKQGRDFGDWVYAMIYNFSGDYEKALKRLEANDRDHHLAFALKNTGHEEEAARIFASVLENVSNSNIRPSNRLGFLSEIHAEMGEYEKSLENLLELEKINPYHQIFELAKHDSAYEGLHGNPEFTSLIGRIDEMRSEARRQIELMTMELERNI